MGYEIFNASRGHFFGFLIFSALDGVGLFVKGVIHKRRIVCVGGENVPF